MRQMKDSGIEWLHKIPLTWKVIKIKNIASGEKNSFADGDWIESNVIVEEGVRYLTTGNIGEGYYKEQGNGFISEETLAMMNCLVVFPGDLVISRLNNPIGRACRLPAMYEKYVIAVDNVVLRPELDLFDLDYLMYAMNIDGYSEEANMASRGATMPRISRTLLGNLKLPNPSVAEQKKIAEYLMPKVSLIDNIIEKTKESIEEYKKYKQALITETVTKGLNPDVKMKDSGIEWIGEIPEHWEIRRLKELVNLKTGKTPSTQIEKYFNGDIIWYKPGDFNSDLMLYGSQDLLAQSAIDDDIVELIPANSVYFVGIGATVGKMGYSRREAFCNQQVTALIPKQIDSEYLLYLMQSANKFIQDNALYTTLPIINNAYLGSIKFSNPSIKEQRKIVNFLKEEDKEIENAISKKSEIINELESYKKSLIYEVVTGKKEIA